jgi:hypothetical protein
MIHYGKAFSGGHKVRLNNAISITPYFALFERAFLPDWWRWTPFCGWVSKKWCSWESVLLHQELPLKLSKQLSSFNVVRPALKLLYIVAHVHAILKRHRRKTSRFRLDRFPFSRLPPDIPRYPSSQFPPSASSNSYMVPHFHLHLAALLSFCGEVNVSGFHCSLATLPLFLFQETTFIPLDGLHARMLGFKGFASGTICSYARILAAFFCLFCHW